MKNTKKIKINLIAVIFALILIITIIISSIIIIKRNHTTTKSQSNSSSNTAKSQPQAANDFIILYNGLDLSKALPDIEMSIPYTDKNKEKYEISYYNYENGNFLGITSGKLEQSYEDVATVQNVSKLAISKDYNPIPRQATEITELPEQLIELTDFDTLAIQEIDLDGDGTKEHIIIGTSEKNNNSATYTNYSCVMLFDSNYNKIETLAYAQDQFWEHDGKVTDKFFISTDDLEYFDIDDDGKMEILLDENIYEGIGVSIYKYENGTVTGNTNQEIIALP